MDRKVALENEVPTIFDLLNRKLPVEIDGSPFFLGELRSEGQTPMVEPFADNVRAQAIGGGLQGLWIRNREERVIVFAEGHTLAQEFALDEVMSIDPKGDGKREERADRHGHRSQDFVPVVEIVMRIARALRTDNTIVGVLGCKLRWGNTETGSSLHALEDEVNAEAILLFHFH